MRIFEDQIDGDFDDFIDDTVYLVADAYEDRYGRRLGVRELEVLNDALAAFFKEAAL